MHHLFPRLSLSGRLRNADQFKALAPFWILPHAGSWALYELYAALVTVALIRPSSPFQTLGEFPVRTATVITSLQQSPVTGARTRRELRVPAHTGCC